jgi:hypothetical protein
MASGAALPKPKRQSYSVNVAGTVIDSKSRAREDRYVTWLERMLSTAVTALSVHANRLALQRMNARLPRLQTIALAICQATSVNLSASTSMFTESGFAQIKFLEGRWRGVAPDGKEFFEEYILVEPTLFRSIRHADSTFQKATDGSTVALENGVITSTWGQFTWRATLLNTSKACFEPVSAPSSFCWERVSPDSVTVTQCWTDSEGKEQSFVLTLNRVAA